MRNRPLHLRNQPTRLKKAIGAVASLCLAMALVSCAPTGVTTREGTSGARVIGPAETSSPTHTSAPTQVAQTTSPAVPTATNTTRSTPTLTTEPAASATRARSTSSPTPSKVADRPSSPYPAAATRTPTLTPNPVIRSGSPTRAIATDTPAQPSPTVTETLATPTVTATSIPSSTSPPATKTAVPIEPIGPMKVEQAFPNLAFERPVFLTHAGDGSNRLFVVEQAGRIYVFPNDDSTRGAEIFLDISDRVSRSANEEGLLGLAFHPEYPANGDFYVYYSATNPRRSVLSRFVVDGSEPNRADQASEQVILEVAQPYGNHNGGALVFGPDGYLYVGLGDGGSGGDPQGHGQNLGTLLGSIIRIDPDAPSAGNLYGIPVDNPFSNRDGARGEIFAYGLRNPWRFSFDPVTKLLWVGDVGQNAIEEIDIVGSGLNYGWNIMEGSHCFSPRSGCATGGLEMPVVEYDHSEGCSVTGGYVYRGKRLAMLYGAYVYGDFCTGRIWALRFDNGQIIERRRIVDSGPQISSFGVDEAGELYLTAFDGRLYRLTPNR